MLSSKQTIINFHMLFLFIEWRKYYLSISNIGSWLLSWIFV